MLNHNLSENFVNSGVTESRNIESKEKELGKLAAVPIFRANDLYSAMFPEIKPTFEKDETPSVKRIIEEISKYKGMKIILDRTCVSRIKDCAKINDFPDELGILEVPMNRNRRDVSKILEILKEKWGITYEDPFGAGCIEKVIDNKFDGQITNETARTLFEIAKQKNGNIQEVCILTDNLTDHVFDPNGNHGESMKNALSILVETSKTVLGIEPKIEATISDARELAEGTIVVVDRHNSFLKNDIHQKMPTQFLLLPIVSEIFNNEEFLKDGLSMTGIAGILRKEFEIVEV